MADYKYDKNDGKIHTRYSELIRCTPGQIESVLAERKGARRVETEGMAFGTERHAMWQEEAEKTKKVPAIFGLDWPVSHVEQEFTSEIMPGVILHSRLDLVCADLSILPDFKTVVDGKQGWKKIVESYRHNVKQRQLKFYAFQAGLHSIRITKGAFLCEIWDGERENILGHEIVEFPITFADIAESFAWMKPRAALLAAALEAQNV